MKLNISTILLLLGALGVLAPDLAGVAASLSSLGVPWLVPVAHAIGAVALVLASLAKVVPKLRGALAAINLATHPDQIMPETTPTKPTLVPPPKA